MTGSAFIVALVVTLNLTASVVLLGRQIVSWERNRFRQSVRQVRLDIADDILANRLPADDTLVAYTRKLDLVSRFISTWSPFQLALLVPRLRRMGIVEASSEREDLYIGLRSASERERMDQHRSRYHAAVARLLFAGSPSGWMVSVVAVPAILLRRRVSRSVPESAVQQTESEQSFSETAYLWSREKHMPTPVAVLSYVDDEAAITIDDEGLIFA